MKNKPILCDECGEPESATQHAPKNWTTEGGEGHPFVNEESIRAEQESIPEPPRCTFPGCGRIRAKHKGPLGHSFTLAETFPVTIGRTPPPSKGKRTESPLEKLSRVRDRALKDSTMGGYVVTPFSARVSEKVERVLELADEIRTRREELELLEQELGGLLA